MHILLILECFLKNGHSNNQAEYVRDLDEKYYESTSKTAYDLPTILYNKLAYLVGEKALNDYVRNNNTYFCDFLTTSLDSKYGEGTGVEMYSLMNDLVLCCPKSYYGDIYLNSKDELKKRYEIIKNKEKDNKELISNYKSDNIESSDKDFERIMAQAQKVNKSYKSTIEDIFECMDNKKKLGKSPSKAFSQARLEVYEKLLKKLEKTTLKCIQKDVKKISCKNEALDYIQLWDYYRNRCAIVKNSPLDLDFTNSSMDKEISFKLTFDIQHELYEKCCKYKALNIKNEKVFNVIIEANLYDINNAKVKRDGEKITISDKYVISKGDFRFLSLHSNCNYKRKFKTFSKRN